MSVPRGRPARPFALSPVGDDLLRLFRTDQGISNVGVLAEREALLGHPALRQRLALRSSYPAAVRLTLADLATFGGMSKVSGNVLTSGDLEAVRVLLNVPKATVVSGRTESLEGTTWKERSELAARLLGVTSGGQFRRRQGEQPNEWSEETNLINRFIAALDVLDAPLSVTRSHRATPVTRLGVSVEIGDLAGTWSGTTKSEWLLKKAGTERAGIIPCFMVIRPRDRHIDVSWFYEHGTTIAMAVQLVDLGNSRRLLCLYEGSVAFVEPDLAPSHRGACVLEVAETPQMSITGTYWTDRATHGELHFDQPVDHYASSFEEAAILFAQP